MSEEIKKAALNASVAPEEFDWEAFENDGVQAGSKEETMALYEQTLNKVTENEVVEGVVTAITKTSAPRAKVSFLPPSSATTPTSRWVTRWKFWLRAPKTARVSW